MPSHSRPRTVLRGRNPRLADRAHGMLDFGVPLLPPSSYPEIPSFQRQSPQSIGFPFRPCPPSGSPSTVSRFVRAYVCLRVCACVRTRAYASVWTLPFPAAGSGELQQRQILRSTCCGQQGGNRRQQLEWDALALFPHFPVESIAATFQQRSPAAPAPVHRPRGAAGNCLPLQHSEEGCTPGATECTADETGSEDY